VDFFAVWCGQFPNPLVIYLPYLHQTGPCRMISPAVEELSLTHPHVVFLKVDVDQSPVCSTLHCSLFLTQLESRISAALVM